jgi:mono/diheme cytochrome c family protein
MSRPVKLFSVMGAVAATAFASAGCGTQRNSVPRSNAPLREGAQLFNQRCAGCHSLAPAAAFGSAASVFTAQFNNGPNFDVRCERPVTRILYAIENGGFSGAIMPQNIVVGQQAINVAKFVATYSGRHAPHVSGQVPCDKKAIGSIPKGIVPTSTSTTQTTASAPAKRSKSTKPTSNKKTGKKAKKGHT